MFLYSMSESLLLVTSTWVDASSQLVALSASKNLVCAITIPSGWEKYIGSPLTGELLAVNGCEGRGVMVFNEVANDKWPMIQ